jgi:hypothetical protein
LASFRLDLSGNLLEFILTPGAKNDLRALARKQLAVDSPIPDKAPVIITTLSLITVVLRCAVSDHSVRG